MLQKDGLLELASAVAIESAMASVMENAVVAVPGSESWELCAFLDHHLVDLYVRVENGGNHTNAPSSSTGSGSHSGVDPAESNDALAAALSRAVKLGKIDALLKSERSTLQTVEARLTVLDGSRDADGVAALVVSEGCTERLGEVGSGAAELLCEVDKEEARVRPLADEVGPLLRELAGLEKARRYVRWARAIARASEVEQLLDEAKEGEGSCLVVDQSMDMVDELCAAHGDFKIFEQSQAKEEPSLHIARAFAAEINSLVRKLRVRLSASIHEALKVLNWPMNASNPSLNMVHPNLAVLQATVSKLVRLQVVFTRARDGSTALTAGEMTSTGKNEVVGALWAVKALVKPIVMRFKYHFGGARQTDRVDKPGWYHNYMLSAAKDHSVFLNDNVQPVVLDILERMTTDSDGGLFVDVRAHFYRALVLAMHAQYANKWETLAKSSALLCNTADEAVAMDKALHEQFGYLGSSSNTIEQLASANWPTLASFFEQDQVRFLKWMDADLEFARKKLATEFAKPTAWQTLSQAVSSVSQVKLGEHASENAERLHVPEICDHLLAVLATVAARARAFSSREAQLLFVHMVLLPLVEDFGMALETNAKSVLASKALQTAGDRLIVLLNAAEYTRGVLQTWQDQTLFIQVSEYQLVFTQQNQPLIQQQQWLQHSSRNASRIASAGSGASLKLLQKTLQKGANVKEMFRGVLDKVTTTASIRLAQRKKSSTQEEQENEMGEAFSVLTASTMQLSRVAINHLELQLCDSMIAAGVLASMQSYAQAAHRGIFATGTRDPPQSAEFVAPVKALTAHLTALQAKLLPALFTVAAARLAKCVGDFFLNSVLEGTHFDQSGGERLTQDFRALCVAFSGAAQRPENRFFRTIKERARLLAQPTTQAASLKAALQRLLPGWDGNLSSIEGAHLVAMLEDAYEVCTVSPQDALLITMQRSDLG